ncbi:MAG: histidine kinase [Anaerocolumna sp.]
MKKSEKGLSLYHKFALVIILVGLFPMLMLVTVVTNGMLHDYQVSITSGYEQAARYISASLDKELESINDISKIPYYYNYSSEGKFEYNFMSFDNLRKILEADGIEPEKQELVRRQNMTGFLQNVYTVDSSIVGTFFLGTTDDLRFPYSGRNTYFKDWDNFYQVMDFDDLDKQTRNMILIPTHRNSYFHYQNDEVFTVARNYFNLSGGLTDQPYVGTIFIDIDMKVIYSLFTSADFGDNSKVYVYDSENRCFYSNQEDLAGENLGEENIKLEGSSKDFMIHIPANEYGLSITVQMDKKAAFGKFWATRNLMYTIILVSILALLGASILFSKKLTRPIRDMMGQMGKLESGDFNVRLPVESNDEIGILSKRFNEMSKELEKYINQSFVAQIKQNEAEMTALKSQIYPHFLFNTLEVIRMTALEEIDGNKVPNMIEALSAQIRYMIGTVQDIVPLVKEVEIVEKYIYLLNCRINGKIHLTVELNGYSEAKVPKLILQPIVENAYIHGFKVRGGNGTVMIDVKLVDGEMEIAVMDDGIGMSKEIMQNLYDLIESDAIGVKREDDWQSIGLKNVHDRVRYLYGEPYGIKVTSQVGVGTMIRIVMPFMKEVEAEDDKDNYCG